MRAGSALLSPEALLELGAVASGAHVVEIGPGRTGHFLFPAARHVGEQGRVTGIDLHRDSLHMLEGLRRQYLVHNIDLLWADVEDGLPLDEASADIVYLVNTAWLLQQPHRVFRDIYRVLRPRGRVVVVDWLPNTTHPLAPRWDFRLTPERLDIALAHLSLRTIGRSAPSPWHFGRVYESF